MAVHPSAIVEDGAQLGVDVAIWRWVHVRAGAVIGDGTSIGQGCYIAAVAIGRRCRIQNHVSVFEGVTLEDDVFLGPSCVFTNVTHPRAHVPRKASYAATRVGRGATIGANATIVCGNQVGPYAMVGAGAVVTRDVPPHGLVVGAPARRIGWACRCGETLPADPAITADGVVEARCASCGDVYQLSGERCVLAAPGEHSGPDGSPDVPTSTSGPRDPAPR